MTTGSNPTPLPEPRAADRGAKPALRVHPGRRTGPREARSSRPAANDAAAEAWPLHSVETLAASLVVVSIAAGWMLAAAAMTGPALAAAEWLAAVARVSEGA